MDYYSWAANYYKRAPNMLADYFLVMGNIQWEPSLFYQSRQKLGKTLNAYHVRLKLAAVTCDFAMMEKTILS